MRETSSKPQEEGGEAKNLDKNRGIGLFLPLGIGGPIVVGTIAFFWYA